MTKDERKAAASAIAALLAENLTDEQIRERIAALQRILLVRQQMRASNPRTPPES